MSTTSAMRGVVVPLQVDETTGNGLVLALPSSFRNHTILIKGSAGIMAGAIQVETSNSPDDAGTWAPIGAAITIVAASDVLSTFIGVYNFIRARISTNVTGGTVSVDYQGN